MLFYERPTGDAEIYETNGHGGMSQIAAYSWRSTWAHIVAGEFINNNPWDDPPTDDLFFLEESTGYCETRVNDGEFSLAASESGFPAATDIVAGSFGGGNDGNANLLCYDAAWPLSAHRPSAGRAFFSP